MFYLEEDTIVQSYQLGPQPVIGPPTILNSIAFLGAQVRSFCTNGSAAILQFSHVTQLPTIMVTLPPQACPTHPALVIYPYGHAAYMPVMSQPPIVRVFGTSLPCFSVHDRANNNDTNGVSHSLVCGRVHNYHS